MTAQELLQHLDNLGVVLAPTQEGMLEYVASDDDFTPRLQALVRGYKPELLRLLAARTPPADPGSPAPPHGTPWRRWVTGQAPGSFTLPAPRYHDSPSAPVTYWGERCTTKACQKDDADATESLRYFPSGACCRCWERWEKTVTREEVDDDGR
jgi:hypothetical protein